MRLEHAWMPFANGGFAVVAPEGEIVAEGLSKGAAEILAADLNVSNDPLMLPEFVPDEFRVLPHRDIKAGPYHAGVQFFEHTPCGMDLTGRDVKEANWCPHCAEIINKAARRRGQAAIAEAA